jgi:hypothetical protein
MSTKSESPKPPTIMGERELELALAEQIGPLASDLLLILRDGAHVTRLSFDWAAAKEYWS